MQQIYPAHTHLQVLLVGFYVWLWHSFFFLHQFGQLIQVRLLAFRLFDGQTEFFQAVFYLCVDLMIKSSSLTSYKLIELIKFVLVFMYSLPYRLLELLKVIFSSV